MREDLHHRLARLAALAFLPALLVAMPARADDGFKIDWQGAEQTPSVAASLQKQIAEVEAAPVSSKVMDFFKAQVITVVKPGTTIGIPGPARAGPKGVFFARGESPPDNPVLLHELIHRWNLLQMPAGAQNPDIIRFYKQAKASGDWPADSYMLKNPFEFFAMTASTVLHGRTSRPPFTRAAVKAKMPELYAFIVAQFGSHDI